MLISAGLPTSLPATSPSQQLDSLHEATATAIIPGLRSEMGSHEVDMDDGCREILMRQGRRAGGARASRVTKPAPGDKWGQRMGSRKVYSGGKEDRKTKETRKSGRITAGAIKTRLRTRTVGVPTNPAPQGVLSHKSSRDTIYP